MLTPSVSPPRPSTESSKPVVEGLCGPDLNKGISTDFNDVGGIYNEVQALIYQHMWPRTFAANLLQKRCGHYVNKARCLVQSVGRLKWLCFGSDSPLTKAMIMDAGWQG